MDDGSSNLEEQEKQPAGSLLNVFGGFFTRDKRPTTAVLTSFKELPDGEKPPTDDPAESTGSMLKEDKTEDKDPDLVQVKKVEIHSDTENEDEEPSNGPISLTAMLAKTRRNTLPEVERNAVNQSKVDEVEKSSESKAEVKVPVFRTHKLKDRSRIEDILYSSRFTNKATSKKSPTSSGTTEGNDCTPAESSTSTIVETQQNNGINVDTGESDEYAAIDCSQPVPSIISGGRPLENDQNEAKTDQDVKQEKDLTESSASPTKIADTSNQASSRLPMSPSSAPEDHLGESKQSASSSPQSSDPKTPDRNLSKLSSPASPPSVSSTSSPSRPGLSSPPSFQMPALFSGLRVLKKGAVGEERETMSEIKQREKDADLALLSLKKTVNKAKLYPDQRTVSPAKKHTEIKSMADTRSTVMGQLSHLLKQENQENTKKPAGRQEDSPKPTKTDTEKGVETAEEKTATPDTSTSTPEKKKTSDMAYETFKNIFGPKTVTKEKTEDVDLEAVRKKIKNDKENLRLIFERASKSPGSEVKSPTEVTTVYALKRNVNSSFVNSVLFKINLFNVHIC